MNVAFHFNLKPLLHYRKLRQHQMELRLEEAGRKLVTLRRAIASIEDQASAIRSQEEHALALGVAAAEMHVRNTFLSALHRQRARLLEQLHIAERAREEIRQGFLAAQRDTEVVETLRQSQFEIYKKERSRSEQRRQDDRFLLRQRFLKSDKSAG